MWLWLWLLWWLWWLWEWLVQFWRLPMCYSRPRTRATMSSIINYYYHCLLDYSRPKTRATAPVQKLRRGQLKTTLAISLGELVLIMMMMMRMRISMLLMTMMMVSQLCNRTQWSIFLLTSLVCQIQNRLMGSSALKYCMPQPPQWYSFKKVNPMQLWDILSKLVLVTVDWV